MSQLRISRLSLVSNLDFICATSAPVVDKEVNQALPGKGRLSAGVCGAAIKWAGLDMVKRLKQISIERLFSVYTRSHSGIDHKAGVLRGGTFILVYEEIHYISR